jgi:hypothetical protein
MAPSQARVPSNTQRERRARRNARLLGAAGFAAAAALPPLLWHRPMAAVAQDFQLDVDYLSGWTGYALLASGLAFLAPVVLSIGRAPPSRLYPRARKAYAAWGICLYLLGFAIATQVATVMRVHPIP